MLKYLQIARRCFFFPFVFFLACLLFVFAALGWGINDAKVVWNNLF